MDRGLSNIIHIASVPYLTRSIAALRFTYDGEAVQGNDDETPESVRVA